VLIAREDACEMFCCVFAMPQLLVGRRKQMFRATAVQGSYHRYQSGSQWEKFEQMILQQLEVFFQWFERNQLIVKDEDEIKCAVFIQSPIIVKLAQTSLFTGGE